MGTKLSPGAFVIGGIHRLRGFRESGDLLHRLGTGLSTGVLSSGEDTIEERCGPESLRQKHYLDSGKCGRSVVGDRIVPRGATFREKSKSAKSVTFREK